MNVRLRVPALVLLISAMPGVTIACASPTEQAVEAERAFLQEAQPADARLQADGSVTSQLGRRICADVAAGRDADDIVADAQRITGGEGYLDVAAAERVVDAARRHLC